MLTSIHAESADSAYRQAEAMFRQSDQAISQPSRCGATLEIPRVAFSIADSRQRYVHSRLPAINPAFAIAEIIWIMNGRNDSRFLNYFNRSLPDFAGDTDRYHGAYGHRLRTASGIDQLARAADALRSKADSRQVVLQIWDCQSDFPAGDGTPASQDVPCNVTSMLKVRDGRLEWTQILRSNDLYRGVPYNFIQFMTLQEIVAGWIGVEPGSYCHLSDSLHIYEADVAEFHCVDSTLIGPPSRLAMSFTETAGGFTVLANYVDELISEEPTTAEMIRSIKSSKLPARFRDMLCVLFAEVARRRKDSEFVEAFLQECEDPVQIALFQRWNARFQMLDRHNPHSFAT